MAKRLVVCLLAGAAGWFLASHSGRHLSPLTSAPDSRSGLRHDSSVAFAAQPSDAHFFVTPSGSPEGDGSAARPWDLATALGQPDGMAPGTIVWLRGGIYRGAFTSRLTGTPQAPITLRAVPGERVVLDGSGHRGSTLTVRGAWAVYWGFEVMNSDPRRITDAPGSRAAQAWRGDGVMLTGAHTKLVNLIIHDNADGIGFWTSAEDAEIYGCLIFNNGWLGPDRGHGHGIYAQNLTGTKRIVDNILFNNFARGINAFGTNADAVGFHIEGNVSFNNYSPAARGGAKRHPNLFVGTMNTPADRITVADNYLYHAPGTYTDLGANLSLGYRQTVNKSVVVRGNYVAGGSRALFLNRWAAATITGNTFYAAPAGDTDSEGGEPGERLLTVQMPPNVAPTSYTWNSNSYFDSTPARTNGRQTAFFFDKGPRRDYQSWMAATGFDRTSRYAPGRPAGTHVFVRQNKYEPMRAHIIVYNWGAEKFADADVSSFLPRGSRYEVRDAQNYFGAPIINGDYNGGKIRIPLTRTGVTAPIGYDLNFAAASPEFYAFVLIGAEPRPTRTRDAPAHSRAASDDETK